jgi:hypothetical protein
MSKGDCWFAKRLLRTFLSGILIFPDPNEVLRRVAGATWRTLIPRCKRHISISATFCSLCELATGKHSPQSRLSVSQIKAGKFL